MTAGRRRWSLIMLMGGFGLLSLAWVVGNPPLASPDEQAHFIKALASASGQFTGRQDQQARPGMTAHEDFLVGATRSFKLPQSRWVFRANESCTAFNTESAACQRAPAAPVTMGPRRTTYVGGYQPFVYVPLGLAARTVSGADLGLRLARLADVALCLILVFGAAFCCRSRWALVGLLAAVTPLALFLFASVNPNGAEVAAAVCFTAATLAVVRSPGDAEQTARHRAAVWGWWTAGGAVLALTKGLGPVWVAFAALVGVGLIGVRAAWRLVAAERWLAIPAALVVGASGVVSLLWDELVMPHPHVSKSEVRRAIGPAVRNLPGLFHQAIGLFGWLDTPVPGWVATAAEVVVVALVVLALVVGNGRQRLVILGSCVAVAAATVAVSAGIEVPIGFGPQARFTLAVFIVVPLTCGAVIEEHRDRLPDIARRWVPLTAIIVLAIVQGAAWYANSRRYAVGLAGPVVFFRHPQWSPPGGWLVLIAVVGVGMAALAAGALLHPLILGNDAAPPVVADSDRLPVEELV